MTGGNNVSFLSRNLQVNVLHPNVALHLRSACSVVTF